MPHAGQIRPLAARRGVAALMGALVTLGCAQSGDVVIVIDSTMQADSVEVVARPASAPGASSSARPPAASSDSVARLRAIEDSAAVLDARFGDLRAALTNDVVVIDTMDRRTRTYATRYDGIVRRSRDAEQVRSARDSLRARAAALRGRLGTRAGSANTTPPRGDGASSPDEPPIERRRVHGASITLSLAPGVWLIGIARVGSNPMRYDSVTVRARTADTLDLRGRPPHRPGGR